MGQGSSLLHWEEAASRSQVSEGPKNCLLQIISSSYQLPLEKHMNRVSGQGNGLGFIRRSMATLS